MANVFGKRNKYGNKKVVTEGGSFDSKLEKYLHDRLTILKIDFQFQVKYNLVPKFNFHGENIREMNSIVDFEIKHNGMVYIVDTKGFSNDVAPIKYKLLKYKLKDIPNVRILWLKDKKEVDGFLINILGI